MKIDDIYRKVRCYNAVKLTNYNRLGKKINGNCILFRCKLMRPSMHAIIHNISYHNYYYYNLPTQNERWMMSINYDDENDE